MHGRSLPRRYTATGRIWRLRWLLLRRQMSSGTASTAPTTPQSQPQNITDSRTDSGFIDSCLPITIGVTKFDSIAWMQR